MCIKDTNISIIEDTNLQAAKKFQKLQEIFYN